VDEALSTVCTGAVLFRAAQSLVVLLVFIGMLNEVHKFEFRHFFIGIRIRFCSIRYSFSCWPSAWKVKRCRLHSTRSVFVVCRRPLHSMQLSPCLMIPAESPHYEVAWSTWADR